MNCLYKAFTETKLRIKGIKLGVRTTENEFGHHLFSYVVPGTLFNLLELCWPHL